jgi:hypothetical protein
MKKTWTDSSLRCGITRLAELLAALLCETEELIGTQLGAAQLSPTRHISHRSSNP